MRTEVQSEREASKQTAMNRTLFRELGLTAISICSAPRAGKTTVLERTLPFLKDEFKVAVLETDLQPRLDAERIRSAGVPVWQIVTGIERRADAGMVAEALRQFPLVRTEVLFIERLIDSDEPSLADWGEHVRAMVYRASPASDIPPNMPNLLRSADALLINTMDCAGFGTIDENMAVVIRQANPVLAVFELRRPAQDDLGPWVSWLKQQIQSLRSVRVQGANI